MVWLSEDKHAGEFLVSEAEAYRSRDGITVLSGQNLDAGAVIGKVLYGIGKADIPTVDGTGNGTMSAVFAGPAVEPGAYVVACTEAVANGGVFSVTTPGGERLPDLTLTVGSGNTTAYSSEHINFSITDGGTDFAVDDTFTITVETGAPSVVGTGNGTLSGLSLGPDALAGRYQFVCIGADTNSGTFELIGPNGYSLGQETITGGAGGTLTFSTRQINATITDGDTDFAVGDFFEVFVWNEPGKAVAWEPHPSSHDGRQRVAGVLFSETDATDADMDAVAVVRSAEVNESEIVFDEELTAAEITLGKQQLRRLGVIPRASDER